MLCESNGSYSKTLKCRGNCAPNDKMMFWYQISFLNFGVHFSFGSIIANRSSIHECESWCSLLAHANMMLVEWSCKGFYPTETFCIRVPQIAVFWNWWPRAKRILSNLLTAHTLVVTTRPKIFTQILNKASNWALLDLVGHSPGSIRIGLLTVRCSTKINFGKTVAAQPVAWLHHTRSEQRAASCSKTKWTTNYQHLGMSHVFSYDGNPCPTTFRVKLFSMQHSSPLFPPNRSICDGFGFP